MTEDPHRAPRGWIVVLVVAFGAPAVLGIASGIGALTRPDRIDRPSADGGRSDNAERILESGYICSRAPGESTVPSTPDPSTAVPIGGEAGAGSEFDELAVETDEPDLFGASVAPSDQCGEGPSWGVWVNVLEFAREDELESDLRAALLAAMRDVPGVTDVFEDDRETYLVTGAADGRALLDAVSATLRRFEPRLRAMWESE